MCRRAKSRAKQQGLSFALTAADVTIPARCPVFGTLMVRNRGKSQQDASPTLDRIVPSKGYVRDNVVVICSRANRIKSDATVGELCKLARFYSNLTRRKCARFS